MKLFRRWWKERTAEHFQSISKAAGALFLLIFKMRWAQKHQIDVGYRTLALMPVHLSEQPADTGHLCHIQNDTVFHHNYQLWWRPAVVISTINIPWCLFVTSFSHLSVSVPVCCILSSNQARDLYSSLYVCKAVAKSDLIYLALPLSSPPAIICALEPHS